MSDAIVRWGILGPGHIARSFAEGLRQADGARLAAVGSRDLSRARAFVADFGVDRAYGSYEELVEDPQIDAVYVATPHSEHETHTILALEAGKHVLCEKPLALDAAQARRMIAVARARDLALMEGLWTRFLPAIRELRVQIDRGAIGTTRVVQADFGFRADVDPESRLFAPKLGGGALLDLGVYPLNLAFMLCGPPMEIHTSARFGATHVDEESAILLRHGGGEFSQLFCALRAETPCRAEIIGTKGRVTIERPWWAASRFELHVRDQPAEEFTFDNRGNGFAHEAEAFMDMIRTGRHHSDIMPLGESLAILETMDTIRERWRSEPKPS